MSQALCEDCKEPYSKTGRNQKRCVKCKRVNASKLVYNHRVKSGSIKQPGVGSGNAQGSGESHHTFKNGIGRFLKSTLLKDVRYCEKCGKDLISAGTHEWCKHHRDHDRNNNPSDGSNWELLCKSCHQLHHQKRDTKTGKFTK